MVAALRRARDHDGTADDAGAGARWRPAGERNHVATRSRLAAQTGEGIFPDIALTRQKKKGGKYAKQKSYPRRYQALHRLPAMRTELPAGSRNAGGTPGAAFG